MKVVIALDTFKGSISPQQGGLALKRGLIKHAVEVAVQPLGDGGEGTLEALKSVGFTEHKITTSNALGQPIVSYYLSKGKIAFFEMATTCGLQQMATPQIMKTNTYGLGEQLLDALPKGFNEWVIWIGGSATHDLGLGALQALGFQFWDKSGNRIERVCGENFACIHKIKSPLTAFPKISVATDVRTNLLDAPRIYGPQKGASPEDILKLEKQTLSLIKNIDLLGLARGGAAGGLAAGFYWLLNAELISGTERLFKELNIERLIREADVVIVGEGKYDRQTAEGKLVSELLKLDEKAKFVLVAGQIESAVDEQKIIQAYSLVTENWPIEKSMQNAEERLEELGEEIGNFLEKYFR